MLESLGTFLKEKLSLGEKSLSGCRACGRCCEAFGGFLRASEADLKRWKLLGRDDLLAHAGETGWLWLDPDTGHRLQRCPYLGHGEDGRVLCGIHDIKPDICRAYPTEAVDRLCVSGVHFPVALWPKKQSDLH